MSLNGHISIAINDMFSNKNKAKLQSTPLTFGGDWILHPNVLEFLFYTITFGFVSKSHPQLDFAVNCPVILLMWFFFGCQISSKRHSCNGNDVMTWHMLNGTIFPKEKTNRKSKNLKSKPALSSLTHEPNASLPKKPQNFSFLINLRTTIILRLNIKKIKK